MSRYVDNLIELIENSDLPYEDLDLISNKISTMLTNIEDRANEHRHVDNVLPTVVVNYDNVFDRAIHEHKVVEHLICTMNQIPKISKEEFYQILDSCSDVVFKHSGRPKLYMCPICGQPIDLKVYTGVFKCECGNFKIPIDKHLAESIDLRNAYSELHCNLIKMGCLPNNLPFVYAGDAYTTYLNAKSIYLGR